LVVFITAQNLVGIDAMILIICVFFRFREFCEIGVFERFDPLNGEQYQQSPKGASLSEPAPFEPS